ncbi:MAG: TolC family protein [Alistipes sp.]|nr:TolC family protein [Alistipes sp.]
MKRTMIAAFLLCGIFTAYGQTPLRLTLDDALAIALSDNPMVKVADEEITRSEYAKKGTYAALFPTIDLSADYQRTVRKQTMYMDTGTGEANKIEVGMSNTWSGGLNASMPLIAPSTWKSLRISGMDVELAVEKARSSRIGMIEQVTRAFYGVLLAQDTYAVYREAYDNAVENKQDVQRKFDVGSTSEYELIRADVQVRNAEPNVYESEHALALAEWQLKALLGMDLDREIACAGTLSDHTGEMAWTRVEISLGDNSDLKQLDIQERQLEKTIEMQRAANYPTLNLTFNYQWISMNNDFKFSSYQWNPYGVAGLSLNVPLFAGGKRRHEVRQAKSSLRQLQLQREDTERNLQVEWMQYRNAMTTSVRQYEAAQASVGEAQKGYDIAVKRYQVGSGTQLEVNDAQLQLTQAQLARNQAIYDYLTSGASLDALSGKYENK